MRAAVGRLARALRVFAGKDPSRGVGRAHAITATTEKVVSDNLDTFGWIAMKTGSATGPFPLHFRIP